MNNANPNLSAPAGDGTTGDAPVSTRRAFLVGVGKKAAYITPVVLTLAATPAVASPHAASCKPLGGSCDSNNDCCSNNCNGGGTCIP